MPGTDTNLRAGAARRDISPDRAVPLYGYPHVERVSTGIHDPLLASVLVLRTGGQAAVVASLDLLMLEPPFARELRRAVADALAVPEACVLVGCTHTHSGPVTTRLLAWSGDPTIPAPDPAYLHRVKLQTVEAARAADRMAVPAALQWTRADATEIGGNRLQPGGLTDPECGILVVRHAHTGAPLAATLVYGMHPTVLHEDSRLVSADFPHYARQQLRERVSPELEVVYLTAPAGNQSPRYHVTGQTFAEAERLGRRLGDLAADAIEALSPHGWQTAPRLAGALAPVALPRRGLPPLDKARALLAEYRNTYHRLQAEGAPRPAVRTAECAVFGAEGTVGLAAAAAAGDLDRMLAAYAPLEVQGLRIGDAILLGLPGECFTEYALAIKRAAPAPTCIASLVNGELQGYIVTPEAAAAGGYEATNAVFAPEAGAVLVQTAIRLATALTDGMD